MDSIVFVVAHPDDVAYGMGGSALLLKNKYKLHVVCATRGERGLEGSCMAETAAIREKEEANACKLLNAELTFLDLIDREVFADKANSEKLGRIIECIDPVAVFTIWPVDSHPDHSAISEMTGKALFLTGKKPELYFCEEQGGFQTRHFVPDIHVDISDVMDEKLEVIRCHKCQNSNDTLAQNNLVQFKRRGRECGCGYAEGFKSFLPLTSNRKSILLDLK
jgi:LmbE family N-acetylglucosaminyl deacetylase